MRLASHRCRGVGGLEVILAVRSVKLKLVLPARGTPEGESLRAALWDTHAFVNACVAHYEQVLLEMRQGPVRISAEHSRTLPADHWQGALRLRLGALGLPAVDVEAALPLLKSLYQAIVKSSVEGQKGTAADGRGIHSKLVDPDSRSGEAKAERQRALAPLRAFAHDPFALEREARALIVASNGGVLKSPGAPPTWVRRYQATDPTWVDALIKELAKAKPAAPEDDDVGRLAALGALPLMQPYGEGRLDDTARGGGLTPIERQCFAMAIGHLNAWESWNFRAEADFRKRSERVARWESEHLPALAGALERVRAIEASMQRHHDAVGFESDRAFRIRPRALRGWDDLRPWLLAHPDASMEARRDRLTALHGRLGRDFGHFDLLERLADPANAALVADPDVVAPIARYNAWQDIVDRTERHPVCTMADARHHPRYAEFDPPKNSNAPPFELEGFVERLTSGERRRVTLKIELLFRTKTGQWERRKFDVPLAASGQLADVKVDREGKETIVERIAQDALGRERCALGGSALLLDRDALERRAGCPEDVYFKLSLDVGAENEAALKARSRHVTWLNAALHNRKTGKGVAPAPGFRVLSVDLGQRTAAAIAVLELAPLRPDRHGEASHHQQMADFRIKRSRTALLALPGEHPTQVERTRRSVEWAGLERIRRGMARLALLRRLTESAEAPVREPDGKTERARQKFLAEFAALDRSDPSDEPLPPADEAPTLDAAGWQAAFEAYEQWLGLQVRAWRRPNAAGGVGTGAPVVERAHQVFGKSMERVDFLERVRRTLISWHLHTRPGSKRVQRLDRKSQGTLARRLLTHINQLKDDRTKTVADLIVQAALGRVWEKGAWRQAFPPVDVIVLEDLRRYTHVGDRPPSENGKLMQWTHREIRRVVEMQAAPAGFPVSETSAAFSSRFDARTGAPGVRCHAVTAEDVRLLRDVSAPRFWLRKVLEELAIDAGAVEAGDLVPTGRGELLVSPDGGSLGGVRVVHADLNAAENIGLRYLAGHRPVVKLGARAVDRAGGAIWLNADMGERQGGALGGQKRVQVAALSPFTPGGVRHRLEVFSTAREAAKALDLAPGIVIVGGVAPDDGPADELDEVAIAESELAALEAEATGKWATFFRDPSGNVHNGHWVESKVFWTQVQREVKGRLAREGKLHGVRGGESGESAGEDAQ